MVANAALSIIVILGFWGIQTISIGTRTLVDNELVLNAPFEAEYEITVVKAGLAARGFRRGKVWRASDGHKRIDREEIVDGATQNRYSVIYDPTNRASYMVYPDEKLVKNLGAGPDPVSPANMFKGAAPEPGNEIEGLPCLVGHATEPSGTRELWASPDLQEILLEKITDGDTERVTRLYNIKRTEPDPDLFKIPSDYVLEPPPPPVTGAIARKKIELKKALEIYNACRGLSGTQLTQAVDRALELFNSAESHGGTIDLHIKDVYIVGRREGDNIYFDEDAFYGALRKMGCDK